jgi:hypothetical protein
MILEVGSPERRLRSSDRINGSGQRVRRDRMRSKLSIKSCFFRDQPFPDGYRLRLHSSKQSVNARALEVGELKLTRKLEDVQGPRVTIELRRERKPRPAPGAKIGHLLSRQGFDRSLLKPRVRRSRWCAFLSLRPAECTDQKQKSEGE